MKTKLVRIVAVGLVAISLLAALPGGARAAAVWYVTPSGNNKHACTSPNTACATINGALAKPGFVAGDSIKVAKGKYKGKGAQVVLLNKSADLSGGWDSKFLSQGSKSTLDGEGVRRGVLINGQITATLDRFVIRNGTDQVKGDGWGGGIKNLGTLTLRRSKILKNSSLKHNNGGYGAGIYSSGSGSLTVLNTSISKNVAFSGGGGIYGEGTIIIRDSTISKNTIGALNTMATHGGAGLWFNNATVTLERSTVSSNKILGDFLGGAIDTANSTVTLNNSTVSANQGPHEAVAVFQTTLNVNNSTIANDTLYGVHLNSSTVNLKHSILANHTTADCDLNTLVENTFTSQGYNVIENAGNCTTALTDVTGSDPVFATLQDYGGPTFTLALLPASPAIDLIPTEACPPPDTDQRGAPRPADGDNSGTAGCDAGAFEVGAEVPIPLATGTRP